MNLPHHLPLLLLAIVVSTCTQQKIPSGPTLPFPLTAVTLLDGPFLHATELNRASLLRYEPDRLLAGFRREAGLEPRAEIYGGWESMSLAGHSLGHYLSGCALMYQTSGEEEFLTRVNYLVDELALCQEAGTGGYIGATPGGQAIFENEIAKGDIRPQAFYLNGIWAPFYTYHKIMAGLRDAYRLCGNRKALAVAEKFADWIAGIVDSLSEEDVQLMLECEHGGIQETLADLYVDSGDSNYLLLAKDFYHKAVLDSLAIKKDILPFKHGNTQIPKLISQARMYQLTKQSNNALAAEFFWSTVVNHHSYVTGGHGNHEYFGRPNELRNRLSDETTETCNVYNMLKLSRRLFLWKPRAEIADYYERALFNHILSSQHPEDGRVIYNLSLEMGGHKHFQNPFGFTCCVGTGMETHSKYGANIYYHRDDVLYVSQYIASELKWEEKGIQLTQNTRYPEEQGSSFTIHAEQPTRFGLALRYPKWARDGVSVRINGVRQQVDGEPGTFLLLYREWQAGDRVELQLPFRLRLEPMPDDQDRIAVCYGPLVLAGDLGSADEEINGDPAETVPVLKSEVRAPSAWLESVPGEVNTFRTRENVGYPEAVTFRPFYQIYDRRYSVYFDLYDQGKWMVRQLARSAEQARRDSIESLTYDYFQPGDKASEQAHDFIGEDTRTFDFKGRRATQCERGGWFAFTLQVKPDVPMTLIADYWGGFTGDKTFDILIDGEPIATENISNKKDGFFLDVAYPIPLQHTLGKRSVEVRFSPHVGSRAGPVFGVRVL